MNSPHARGWFRVGDECKVRASRYSLHARGWFAHAAPLCCRGGVFPAGAGVFVPDVRMPPHSPHRGGGVAHEDVVIATESRPTSA